MTATVVFTPVQINNANQLDYTEVTININAQIISQLQARRRVNGWLCIDVGDRVVAGEPELIINGSLRWRVPIMWTSPTKGILAERVCDVFVDAQSGEVLNPEQKIIEIEHHVASVARTLSTTAA